MTVRSCQNNGQPGFQNRPAEGQPGPCHTYTEGDDAGKRKALHAAVADWQAAEQPTQPA